MADAATWVVKQAGAGDGFVIVANDAGYMIPVFSADLDRCLIFDLRVGDRLKFVPGMFRPQIERLPG